MCVFIEPAMLQAPCCTTQFSLERGIAVGLITPNWIMSLVFKTYLKYQYLSGNQCIKSCE